MTDKQQIENMAQILFDTVEDAVTFKQTSVLGGHVTTNCYKFAERLYNANYRRVPENAVVLTEEEYNALMLEQKRLKEIVDRIPCGYELKDKTRKETANEFYNKVNENICSFKLENKSQEFIDGYAQAIADICGRLDQVAKQFGVEVE